MNVYRPILGASIRLDSVSSQAQQLICELTELLNKFKRGENSPGAYAEEGRSSISRVYPEQNDFMRAFQGPVGKVFRDCFYRLVIFRAEPEKRPQILRNLRYHPGRALLDRFLAEWGTQFEFAAKAGLDPGVVSTCFRSVLGAGGDEPTRLSMARFQDACENLGLVIGCDLMSREPQPNPDATPWDTSISPEFPRDRQLRIIAATVLRCVLATAPDRDALDCCIKTLGLHLAAIHGIRDVLLLDRFVNLVLEDILRRPSPSRLDPNSLYQPQTIAEMNQVQLGLRSSAAPVVFSTDDTHDRLVKLVRRGAHLDPVRSDSILSPAGEPTSEGSYVPGLLPKEWESALFTFEKWVNSWHFTQSRDALASAIKPGENLPTPPPPVPSPSPTLVIAAIWAPVRRDTPMGTPRNAKRFSCNSRSRSPSINQQGR